MTPQEGLAHFAGLSPSSIKMGLERVQQALAQLGHPERKFPALHVAGTNGKGSTCAIAASCLTQKYRTGLYTSPHLIRPNERIQLDGVEIDDATFGRRIAEVVEILGTDHELTYFEFGTVVAFWHFAQERVDVAVLEVGLGGRLDATTACVPLVTTITAIDFDHMEYLGNTLTAIAGEKAGIIKPGVPVISSAQASEALEVIQKRVSSTPLGQTGGLFVEGRDFRMEGSTFHGVKRRVDGLQLPLKGPHQQQNLAVALASLEALTAFPLTDDELREGVRTTRWPGRLESFPGPPEVVLDGAHNPAGVRTLLAALDSDFAGRPVHLIFGVFADKDSEPMMRALFPRVDALYLAPVGSPRSKDPSTYEALARQLCARVSTHPDARAALRAARAEAPNDAVVLVAGSLFLVGQLRQVLLVDRGGSTVSLSDAMSQPSNAPSEAESQQPPPSADPKDLRIAELTVQLEAAQKRVNELAHAIQAGDRDREAFKQRVTREREQLLDVEKGQIALALVEAVDQLDLCLQGSDDSPLAQGVRMIRGSVLKQAEGLGVERLELDGKPFDPNFAEATDMEITTDEAQDGRVVKVLKAGYQLKGRVIRAGVVKVAKFVKPAEA